jgi:hypothetical protein
MHEFDRCIGVELLENLFKKSVEMKSMYDSHVQQMKNQHKAASINPENRRMPSFEVYQGDLLEFDWWSTADLVLANSTCFEFSLMQ